jgi:hypothetical protein
MWPLLAFGAPRPQAPLLLLVATGWEAHRFLLRIVYWLLTGALLGVGLIAILTIGSLFLLLGVILVVIGAFRVGPRGIWATLVGSGAAGAAILTWDVASAPRACQGGEGLPNVNDFSCVETPFGPLTTYHVLALIFGVIAVLGLVWPVAQQLWIRLRSQAA